QLLLINKRCRSGTLRDQAERHTHLRLDAQHEDAWRLDAEPADVEDVLAIDSQAVAVGRDAQFSRDGRGHAVEGEVAVDAEHALLPLEGGGAAHLPEDRREPASVHTALQL